MNKPRSIKSIIVAVGRCREGFNNSPSRWAILPFVSLRFSVVLYLPPRGSLSSNCFQRSRSEWGGASSFVYSNGWVTRLAADFVKSWGVAVVKGNVGNTQENNKKCNDEVIVDRFLSSKLSLSTFRFRRCILFTNVPPKWKTWKRENFVNCSNLTVGYRVLCIPRSVPCCIPSLCIVNVLWDTTFPVEHRYLLLFPPTFWSFSFSWSVPTATVIHLYFVCSYFHADSWR